MIKNLIEKLKALRIYAAISRFLFPYKTWIEMREKSKDEYGDNTCEYFGDNTCEYFGDNTCEYFGDNTCEYF